MLASAQGPVSSFEAARAQALPRPRDLRPGTSRWPLVLAEAAWISGSVVDLHYSDRIFAVGLAREGNPILTRRDGSFNRPLAIGVTAGVAVGGALLSRRHPWWAFAALTAGGLVRGVIGGRTKTILEAHP